MQTKKQHVFIISTNDNDLIDLPGIRKFGLWYLINE